MRMGIAILSWLVLLVVVLPGTTADGAVVLGRFSNDTILPSFWQNQTNADRVVAGINANATLPLTVATESTPAAASQFSSVTITNASGVVTTITNGSITLLTTAVIQDDLGNQWVFDAASSNRVARVFQITSAVAPLAVKTEVTNQVTAAVATKVTKTGDSLSGVFTALEGMTIFHNDLDGVSGSFSFGLGTNQSANTVSRLGATETLTGKTLTAPVLTGSVGATASDLAFVNGGSAWNFKTGTSVTGDTTANRSLVTNALAAAVAPLAVKTEVTNQVTAAVAPLALKTELTNLVASATNAMARRTEVTNQVTAAVAPLAVKTEVTNQLTAAVAPLAVKTEVTNQVTAAVATKVTKTGDSLSGVFTALEGMTIFHNDLDGVSGSFSFGLGTNQSANTVSRLGASETLTNKRLESPILTNEVNVANVSTFNNGSGVWNWNASADANTVTRKSYVDALAATKFDKAGGAIGGAVTISGGSDPQLRVVGNLKVEGMLEFLTAGLFLVPSDDWLSSAVNIGPKIGMAATGGGVGITDYMLSPTNHLGLTGYLTLEDGQANSAAAGLIVGMQNDDFVPFFIQQSLNPNANAFVVLDGEGSPQFVITADGAVQAQGATLGSLASTNGIVRSVSGDLMTDGTSTSHLPEGTNQYHTAARVLASALTGINAGSGGEVTGSDTVLQAFGKLENRVALNDVKTTGSNRVAKAGDTMTGLLVLSDHPTSSLHAATKFYVDGRVATNGPLALLTGLDTATAGAVAASDTMLVGVGKLEKARLDLAATKLDETNGVAYHLTSIESYWAGGARLSQVAVATNYTVPTNVVTVKTSTTGGPRTNTLPAAASSAGRWHIFKDNGGVANVNPLVIDPAGSELIDGASEKIIDVAYGWGMALCDGTSWQWMPGWTTPNYDATQFTTASGGNVALKIGALATNIVLRTTNTANAALTVEGLMTRSSAGLAESLGGTIFRGLADVTVGNTTTESTIIPSGSGSLTLPANWWQAGRTVRVRLTGQISTKASSANLTIRVKAGATTVATKALALGGSLNGDAFDVNLDLACRATGNPGTFRLRGSAVCPTAVGAITSNRYAISGSTGFDTTASGAINVTAEWATVNAANTVTVEIARVEVLP